VEERKRRCWIVVSTTFCACASEIGDNKKASKAQTTKSTAEEGEGLLGPILGAVSEMKFLKMQNK